MLKPLGKFFSGVLHFRGKAHPPEAQALMDQGDQHFSCGDLINAEKLYREAISINPQFAPAYSKLGLLLDNKGQFSGAIKYCQQAIKLNPVDPEAHYHMGLILNDCGKPVEAISHFQQALSLHPEYVEAFNNMGNSFNIQNKLDEAVHCYQKALELKPDYVGALNNLIFILDLSITANTHSLQEVRRKWDSIHAAPLHRPSKHANLIDPERRIRIGYVSADFREHSAANIFGMMLVKFDKAQFDVIAYSNTIIEDGLSHYFQQHVSVWKRITGLPDNAVAELIIQDDIDILVDLSGYSTGNRLLVFARKPAPIQITAWGYATSTGLRAMDIFFADPILVPPNEKSEYIEEIHYLPSFVGYYRPQEFPVITTLPALETHIITFGSFNRLVKISDNAYQTWAKVLHAVPNSRMVIKTPELDDLFTQGHVLEHFTQEGISSERIVLLGRTSWLNHTTAFNQIDIALDPFPHGGGVTTLEGLMMGVPVVTLRWPTVVGRLSASILTTLGLTDWIAETQEEYIQLAVQKASDLNALAELRQKLRPLFTSSIIGDADAYVRAVETEYRNLWREWCQQQTTK